MSAFSMPGATAVLVCDPGQTDDHVEVTICDGALEPLPLAYNLGRLKVEVVPGAYKVEFRTGTAAIARVVVLAEGERVVVGPAGPLLVDSAAPLRGSSTSHEYQTYPAIRESRVPPPPPPPGQRGGSHLFIFVRDHDEAARTGGNPAAGLSLHHVDGAPLFDLGRATPAGGRHGRHDAHGHWTALHANLDPGAYLLRLETATKGMVHQVVHTCGGWQTQVFLLARSYGHRDERHRQADLARASVFMTRAGVGFRAEKRDLYLTEVALRALADDRAVPGAERSEMLWAKHENPVLGLFGAFLHLRRPSIDPHLMRTAFSNLTALLGPHPDLLALGWALVARWDVEGHPRDVLAPVVRAVEQAGAIHVPPMLRMASDAVAAASFVRPGLVAPESLAERVTTRMLLRSPWLLWTSPAEQIPGSVLPSRAAPAVDRLVRTLADPVMRSRASGEPLLAAGYREALKGTVSEAVRASAAFASSPAGVEGGARVIARLQEGLDAIAQQFVRVPELGRRLSEDPTLTPLERRVALAAFPETDPFFADMARRHASGVPALLQATRPTAAELAETLRVPAGTLLRAVLGLAVWAFRQVERR